VLSKELEEAINNQINAEVYSGYLYMSMSSYFESMSLKGFAHWMRVQTLEEMTHAQKFINFVNDRGGRVILQPVEGPGSEWESPLAAFEAAYAHEVLVTGLINGMMDLALKGSDHATASFLNWFVDEQVEEEATADDVVQKLKLVDKTEGGLFLLDIEMDKRVFTLPQDLVGLY